VVWGIFRVVEEMLTIRKTMQFGGRRPGQSDSKDSFHKTLRNRPTDRMNKPTRHTGHNNFRGSNDAAVEPIR
jgi:hypothetical protein